MEGGMCKKGRGRSKAVEGVRAGGGRELQDKRKKEEKIKNQVLDYKWRKKEDLKQTTEEREKLLWLSRLLLLLFFFLSAVKVLLDRNLRGAAEDWRRGR